MIQSSQNKSLSRTCLWYLRDIWVWVNTYRYIFSGMNIHLPAILGFTRYQGFDPSPYFWNNMWHFYSSFSFSLRQAGRFVAHDPQHVTKGGLEGWASCLTSFVPLPSGKHTKNYGKSPFSWVNQLFQWPWWPCSIGFCMFTRPGMAFIVMS